MLGLFLAGSAVERRRIRVRLFDCEGVVQIAGCRGPCIASGGAEAVAVVS